MQVYVPYGTDSITVTRDTAGEALDAAEDMLAGQGPGTGDGTGADHGEWLRSLRETGGDGTDDPPDPGMIARAHGWVDREGS